MVEAGHIELKNVSKFFDTDAEGRVQILSHVSLNIKPGSFTSIIGASGCGKSTLLRLISGFIFPEEGTVKLDGKEVTGPGVDRGFMFQDHVLFPWLTIHDNIAFGLKAQGIYKKRRADVDEMIHVTGLDGFANHYPHQVSGGMQQRASLARALIGKPEILLLDEPLGALDAFTRMNMQVEIEKAWEKSGMTMIMVTHDIEEAVYMSDRVLVMSTHPGTITKEISIDLPRPRARDSEEFLRYKSEILRELHYGEQ